MAKKIKKKELGLGIRALLSNIETKVEENPEEVVKELSSSVAMIPIAQIHANPEQPRTDFEKAPLNELAESIKVHGLIQPITLRRMGGNTYQIISGERRYRASKIAGLTEVPAYIRIANDQEMLEMALIENIQREDLNPIEIAITYARLKKEFSLTDKELAERVGKGRTTITSYLGVMGLPEEVIEALRYREITMGHAKALLGITDKGFLVALCKKVVNEGLSVREIETLVRASKEDKKSVKKPSRANLPTEYRNIQDKLRNRFEAKVSLKLDPKKEGKGQISISFENTEELNRLLDMMEE